MKIIPSHVYHIQAVLDGLLLFSTPADLAVSRYFKEHKNLGVRDRGIIAEAAYAVLRNKLSFGHLAESGSGPLARRLAILGLIDQFGVDMLDRAVMGDERDWARHIAKAKIPRRLLANTPDWLQAKLVEQYGEETALAMALSWNEPAPLDLRVNTLKLAREDAQKALEEEGIPSTLSPFSPAGLRLEGKPALQYSKLMQNGSIEVQDEGSQLLAHLLAPKRGEFVVDFCAGAGGKTLAIGAIMKNTGRLYAMDISERRLAKLKPRLARSGLSNVHPVRLEHEKDAKLKRFVGKVDRVLVDAPCSGLGTVRRNPDLKWRQLPSSVAEMNVKQAAILEAAARLAKPGGTLVYATCSPLREENEAIVETFLEKHDDWELVSAAQMLERHSIQVSEQKDLYLRLAPHVHATDGFFAACLQRKAG